MDLGPLLWDASDMPLLRGRTHLYEQGLLRTGPFGRNPVVHRWDEVTDLRYSTSMELVHDRSMGSVISRTTHRLTIEDSGTSVDLIEDIERTLASDFFQTGIRERSSTPVAERVADAVRERVAAAQLPSVQSRLSAGDTVDFGPYVSATAGELRCRDKVLSWQQVSWLGYVHSYSWRPMSGGGAYLRVGHDRDQHWLNVAAEDVANLMTLERLYASIPRVPQRLVVTGDYEPPAADPGCTTLYLRCPGCGAVGRFRRMPAMPDPATGDYAWPVKYECGCGHASRLTRQDVVPRDSEWTCTRPGCETLFAVPVGAVAGTCPVCRVVHDLS